MNTSQNDVDENVQNEIKRKLTEKIDHILYTEWDPIGVHLLEDFDCSGEYHSYLPTIVEMVLEGASIQAIANQLLVFDEMIWGDYRGERRCLVIAAMVSRYGPEADKNTFVPVVNTENTQSAYQSVLDLLVQTRLDEYEGNWARVCDTYEQVLQICAESFPERSLLTAACLNNLGRAYGYAGRPEKAVEAFSKALSEFETNPGDRDYSLLTCLANVINCHEHLGQHAATIPYLQRMHLLYVIQDGDQSELAMETNVKLNQMTEFNGVKPSLQLTRVDVEKDSGGRIQSIVMLD